MTSISKQLIMNSFGIPKEIIDIMKDFVFYKIKKIPKNDERYSVLLTIPLKEYDPADNTTFVYMRISDEKDYFLTYSNFEIQLQTLGYGTGDDNTLYFIEGHSYSII